MRLDYHHATAICFAWVATVWSTVFSFRANPLYDETLARQFNPDDPRSVIGHGGFPFRAFAYPTPPMGPGPSQSLAPLAANFLFWLLACYLVIRWSGKKETEMPGPFGFSILLVAVSTLFWFGYMVLKFD